MKMNKFDSIKISKERTGIRKQYNDESIRITKDKICMKGSILCKNNSSRKCYECAIMLGDEHLKIQYEEMPQQLLDENKQTPIQRLERNENFKQENLTKPSIVDAPKIDEADTPHFTKFEKPEELIHMHTDNEIFHKHYFVNVMWTRCYICFEKIVGRTCCQNCGMLFFHI